jgi:hypothetical protein
MASCLADSNVICDLYHCREPVISNFEPWFKHHRFRYIRCLVPLDFHYVNSYNFSSL